jgi:hypothetical protein
MFIENFHGIYEHPSTAETVRTTKQKHDESFHYYVKHFYNARNAILYIQDIEIINVFPDGVSDIKTVEEIAMNYPKMVADLLAVADVCIEASEDQAQLLESCGKGPTKKNQDDRDVNTTNREIAKIVEIADIVGIASSSPRIRRKRGISIALMMQRSGVRSIVLQDTIWKSAKIFWITRRCHH